MKILHVLYVCLQEGSGLLNSALSVSPGTHLTSCIFPKVRLYCMCVYNSSTCVCSFIYVLFPGNKDNKSGGFMRKGREGN